jgi:hypothetical protein
MSFSDPMGDSVTEVTSKSWFGRVQDSAIGALIGLLLLVAGIALLTWNERSELRTLRSLSIGAHMVEETAAAPIDPALDGKLVHLSGTLAAPAPAHDPVFGAVTPDAMRLSRHVTMYQWEEKTSSTTQKSLGGGSTTSTTYSYERVWSDRPIDSSHFHVPADHANPPMALHSETTDAAGAAIGPRVLDPAVLDRLTQFAPATPPAGAALPAGWTLGDQGLFHGADPANPAIGDLRASFGAIASGPVSVIAGQSGTRLIPFPTQSGPPIALADTGDDAAPAMFGEARSAAHGQAWLLRAIGFVLILIGLFLLVHPLAVLVSVVPFLESVVDFAGFIVVFGTAILVALATIAVARIIFQPLLSAGLIAAGVVVFIVCARLRGPKRTAAAR